MYSQHTTELECYNFLLPQTLTSLRLYTMLNLSINSGIDCMREYRPGPPEVSLKWSPYLHSKIVSLNSQQSGNAPVKLELQTGNYGAHDTFNLKVLVYFKQVTTVHTILSTWRFLCALVHIYNRSRQQLVYWKWLAIPSGNENTHIVRWTWVAPSWASQLKEWSGQSQTSWTGSSAYTCKKESNVYLYSWTIL